MSFNITTDIFNVYEEEIRFYYTSKKYTTIQLGGGGIYSTTMFRQL